MLIHMKERMTRGPPQKNHMGAILLNNINGLVHIKDIQLGDQNFLLSQYLLGQNLKWACIKEQPYPIIVNVKGRISILDLRWQPPANCLPFSTLYVCL